MDPDGDGSVWGDDCDNGDAGVSPSVEEVWYDDVDNDCDPSTSDDDADGDGFEALVSGGEDCDDTSAAINPQASDIVDGIDQNCDGVDGVDQDRDGFASEVSGGEDCDDGDATRWPGAEEVCGDGVVSDCSQTVAEAIVDCSASVSLGAATARLLGEQDGDHAGYAVSGAGDVDGDGRADLLVGAHAQDEAGVDAGAAYLVIDGIEESPGLDTAIAKLVGEAAGDQAGVSVASVEDVNADGRAELLVGASAEDSGGVDAGAAYLVLSPVTGNLSLSAATAKLLGEAANDSAGLSVAGVGDANGDGCADFLVGAYGHDTDTDNAGAAYLASGCVSGALSLRHAPLKLLGEASSDGAGSAVSGVGDIDGDGLADLFVGAEYEDSAGDNAGAAYLVLGGVSGIRDLGEEAEAKLVGETAGDLAGHSLAGAGDADGDGHADLLVGAVHQGNADEYAGAAYLVLGGVSGMLSLADADAIFRGESSGDRAGRSVAGAGDVDADGHDDIVIGAYCLDGGVAEPRAAYLVFGGMSGGAMSLGEADVKFMLEAEHDYAGFSVSGVGDVDADGYADLFIGAYGQDSGGAEAGAAYLVLAQSLF